MPLKNHSIKQRETRKILSAARIPEVCFQDLGPPRGILWGDKLPLVVNRIQTGASTRTFKPTPPVRKIEQDGYILKDGIDVLLVFILGFLDHVVKK